MRVRRTPAQTLTMIGLGAVRTLASVAIVLAFFSVGLRLYLDRGWHAENADGRLENPPTAMARFQTIQHLDRLEAALEVFRLWHGRYPASLVEMVNDGLVPGSDLSFPDYREPYYYRQAGESYVLFPPRY